MGLKNEGANLSLNRRTSTWQGGFESYSVCRAIASVSVAVYVRPRPKALSQCSLSLSLSLSLPPSLSPRIRRTVREHRCSLSPLSHLSRAVLPARIRVAAPIGRRAAAAAGRSSRPRPSRFKSHPVPRPEQRRACAAIEERRPFEYRGLFPLPLKGGRRCYNSPPPHRAPRFSPSLFSLTAAAPTAD